MSVPFLVGRLSRARSSASLEKRPACQEFPAHSLGHGTNPIPSTVCRFVGRANKYSLETILVHKYFTISSGGEGCCSQRAAGAAARGPCALWSAVACRRFPRRAESGQLRILCWLWPVVLKTGGDQADRASHGARRCPRRTP